MAKASKNSPITASSWDSGDLKGEQSRGGLRLVMPSPNAANGTVAATTPPKRIANADRRPREHLSRDEVERLIKAVRAQSRYADRDCAMVWLAFNHGLRASELVDLRWADVRWTERVLYVRRLKGSRSGEHILTERDKRFLGPLRRKGQRPSDHVFVNERGGAVTAAGFRKMLSRLSLPDDLAALALHPHMLRHSCGYDMVGRADLQARAAFLGHVRLENTIRYSHLNPDQFEGLRD
jgi:site-specific recombinase XerD